MAATSQASPLPQRKTTEVGGMLGAYFRFHAVLSRICLQIAVIGLVVIIAAVLYQVWGRYVMNSSPTWTELVALVLVLWVSCFAAAVGVRDGRHIGMESLLVYAPPKMRMFADLIVYVGMIIFGLFMAYGSEILAQKMWPFINPGLPISQGWSYVPLCVGGLLIALFAVERIVARVNNVEIVPSWN